MNGWMSRLILALVVALAAPAHADMRRMEIRIGDHAFHVEVAETTKQRMRGLMFRESMGAREGMLFIQPQPAPTAFWMKNTLIALDMLFYDSEGRLLASHLDVPPCTTPQCPSYPAFGPVKYIVELNGGTFERLGLGEGDRLRLD